MTASELLMHSTYARFRRAVGAYPWQLSRQLLAVPAGALGETLRACLRLSGAGHCDTASILSSHRLVHAQRPLAQDAAPIRSKGSLWKLGQSSRQRHRLDQGCARRRESLDKADAKSLDGVDWAAGQDQVHRAALTDHSRQPDAAEVDQRNAESPVEDAQGRITPGDPEVATEGQLQPARDGVALDRGDDRLVERHSRRTHRTWAGLVQAVAFAARKGLQVET